MQERERERVGHWLRQLAKTVLFLLEWLGDGACAPGEMSQPLRAGAGQVGQIFAAGLREVGSHFLLPEPGCNVWLGHPLDQEQRATFPAFTVNDIGSLKLKA